MSISQASAADHQESQSNFTVLLCYMQIMKFLLDAMCGRMCRWLRCLGVDAEFIAQPPGKQVLAQASSCSVYPTNDQKVVASRGLCTTQMFVDCSPLVVCTHFQFGILLVVHVLTRLVSWAQISVDLT